MKASTEHRAGAKLTGARGRRPRTRSGGREVPEALRRRFERFRQQSAPRRADPSDPPQKNPNFGQLTVCDFEPSSGPEPPRDLNFVPRPPTAPSTPQFRDFCRTADAPMRRESRISRRMPPWGSDLSQGDRSRSW